MTNNIISTTQADNWFFYHNDQIAGSNKFTFHRVAVWVTYENGDTVGLVSVNLKANQGQRLVTPPTVEGGYIHWNELTEEQKKQAILMANICNDYPKNIGENNV